MPVIWLINRKKFSLHCSYFPPLFIFVLGSENPEFFACYALVASKTSIFNLIASGYETENKRFLQDSFELKNWFKISIIWFYLCLVSPEWPLDRLGNNFECATF